MHTNELVVCILELVVLCILLVRVVNYNSRAMYYYSTTRMLYILITELVYWSMNTRTRVASILRGDVPCCTPAKLACV